MAVLEGESLVNDASALVVLRTAIAAIAAAHTVSWGHVLGEFVWAVAGAMVVGVLVGWLTVLLRERLDDPVLNTTISFAVPFLAYVPAERVEASGVLAVVMAGLITGSWGSRRFSARDRQTQATTWTTINFVLESAVFLAMGYQLPEFVEAAKNETTPGSLIGLVAVVLGLLVLLRFLSLAQPMVASHFGLDGRQTSVRERLDGFEKKLEDYTPENPRQETRLQQARVRLARGKADADFEEREPITATGAVTLACAGMRGVVTVAAVQTIPVGTDQRATVVLAAVLVALATLAIFGLSLPAVIRRAHLPADSPDAQRDLAQELLADLGKQALSNVGDLDDQLIDGQPVDPELIEQMRERILPRLLSMVREGDRPPPDAMEQILIVQRRYLDAMRDALAFERSIGIYPTHTYRQVEKYLDAMEQRIQL